MFKHDILDVQRLSMKGKNHPNGYIETSGQGKAEQLGRSIYERCDDYPNYRQEFGYFKSDIIQGNKHHSAVITLIERISKVEIILNIHHRTAERVKGYLNDWLGKVPRHLFKSITPDNGKEFASWREITNKYDIHNHSAEVSVPNQRGLNENNNGIIGRDVLYKHSNFRNLSEQLIQKNDTSK